MKAMTDKIAHFGAELPASTFTSLVRLFFFKKKKKWQKKLLGNSFSEMGFCGHYLTNAAYILHESFSCLIRVPYSFYS